MKIGIYGGTFNPPHLGHMAAARDVTEALGLDRLILIPDRTPPHKELPAGSATAQQRLEMTKLAADRLELGKRVEVSDLELRRTGKSYTVDTLTELKKAHPKDELWLLMGTDMFLTFHQWYQPERICQLANLVAFGRAAGDEAQFGAQKERLERDFGAKVSFCTLPNLVEVSSTELRTALAEGRGQDRLDCSIYGYILRHGLYGTHADLHHLSLEDLRACSYSMVKAKRLPHIRGTEEEAAKLARRWGADELDARKAAILHDCTKYWNLEQQLKSCEKYGILLDQVERHTLSLLHAKSGAGVARTVYGMPDRICNAILWHTTGKANMTLLEKILYIADYSEPSRSYDWCGKLRELVMEDLDAAVLYGLEITINHTRKKEQTIHYRTIEARDYLLSHRKA